MKSKIINVSVLIILAFAAYFTNANTWEMVGAFANLLSVWAYANRKIWTATISGVVGVLVWGFLFYNYQLYADSALQILFFLPLTIWGLYVWLTRRGKDKIRPTRNITKKEIVGYCVAFVTGSAIWAMLLDKFSNASIPWADAPIAVASIIAQSLLSTKVIQNWHVWIAVNIASIPLYWYKDLKLTAALYVVFLINAVYGYIAWRKDQKNLSNI